MEQKKWITDFQRNSVKWTSMRAPGMTQFCSRKTWRTQTGCIVLMVSLIKDPSLITDLSPCLNLLTPYNLCEVIVLHVISFVKIIFIFICSVFRDGVFWLRHVYKVRGLLYYTLLVSIRCFLNNGSEEQPMFCIEEKIGILLIVNLLCIYVFVETQDELYEFIWLVPKLKNQFTKKWSNALGYRHMVPHTHFLQHSRRVPKTIV